MCLHCKFTLRTSSCSDVNEHCTECIRLKRTGMLAFSGVTSPEFNSHWFLVLIFISGHFYKFHSVYMYTSDSQLTEGRETLVFTCYYCWLSNTTNLAKDWEEAFWTALKRVQHKLKSNPYFHYSKCIPITISISNWYIARNWHTAQLF